MEKKELRRLANYQSDTPVLSVYLNVDPKERTSDEYLLSLRHLLEEVKGEAAPEDISAVQQYFEHEYDWSGRGAVVFSCAADDYRRTYTLAVPVASGATIARRPYLSPLVALMNAYGQYVVALVDRQGVRMFSFRLGKLVQAKAFEGKEVRRSKKGRGSSGGPGRRGGAPMSSRHGDEVALRNLRDSAKHVERFCRRQKPQHLILAGVEHTISLFTDLLPKALKDIAIGPIGLDSTATEPEIRKRSLELLQQVENKRKAGVVEAAFTAAAKGREGVIGLDETLSAAHEGRIQTLVIGRDYHASGYRCDNCRYLTTQSLTKCPFCEGTFVEIPDAAEAAVTKVIEDGGEIEVVDQNPKLDQAGIGAILRY
jgi:hypothetical protein